MSASNLELTIRLSNGTRLSVDCGATTPTECTVLQVKQKLTTECPVERQRLIYKGRILEDDRTLQDYGIISKATLFLVKGGAAAAPAPTGTTASSTSTTSAAPAIAQPPQRPTPAPAASATPSNPPNPWGAVGQNPMLNSMMGGGMGMPLPPVMADPQQMQAMLNSPMMQSLLDNPQLMQSMMEFQMQTNPQMRQVMENNPALRQMMSDPAVLRQVSEMMRNPAAMQQAMRNQDLAMSNIENMPGGFAALSNMYRDIQEPLEESMRNGAGTGAASSSSSTATENNNNNRHPFDAGASGSAMPNPWGIPPPTLPTTAAATTTAAANTANNPWAPSASSASSGTSAPGSGNTAAAGNTLFNSPMAGNPFASSSMMMPLLQPGQPPSQEQIDATLRLMENPIVRQMIEQAMQQNPGMFRQTLGAQNPMMAQLFANNPALADQMMRDMMNPDVIRSMMNMQRSMQNAGFAVPPGPPPSSSASGGVVQLDFSQLLQQMNNTGLGVSSNGMTPPSSSSHQHAQAPADRYRNQLRSLYDMGFDDEQQCLAALQATHGNLNRAVDILLAGDVPSLLPNASSTAAAVAATPASATGAAAATTNQQESAMTQDKPIEEEKDASTAPKDATEKKND